MRRLLTFFLVLPLLGALAALAAAQSPTPTEAPTASVNTDIMPGVTLTVEEVEPGVYRVVHDGVRDLTAYLTYLMPTESPGVVAGEDGSLWNPGRQQGLYRVSARRRARRAPAWDGRALRRDARRQGLDWPLVLRRREVD